MHPGNVPSAKVLTTALCTVLAMTVALLMKACATAWPTASIGRSACLRLQPPPASSSRLSWASFVLTPWVLACPKQVCLGAWACFDPIEPDSCSLIGCAFCLDLWSVFPCSWSVFSPLFHLHTNIYQHSWKWLVINPYHYVDVYILCIYAGVDGLNLVLKSRQQLPHT